PHLSPFPTRRSSDLHLNQTREPLAHLGEVVQRFVDGQDLSFSRRGPALRTRAEVNPHGPASAAPSLPLAHEIDNHGPHHARGVRDRKSTRLNSSDVE